MKREDYGCYDGEPSLIALEKAYATALVLISLLLIINMVSMVLIFRKRGPIE